MGLFNYKDIILVTMDSVQGKQILEIKGLVYTNTIILSNLENNMRKAASQLGANAVVGIKYSNIGNAQIGLLGTAVIIE